MTKRMVTQSELARELNVSRQRVSAMVKQGLFTPNSSGKIDLDLALQRITENKDESRGGKQAPVSLTFQEARTLKETALARLRQLEADEKENLLVNVDEIRFYFADVITVTKTRLRAVPVAIAQEAAHIGRTQPGRAGEVAIMKLMLESIDDALRELTQWQPERRYNADEKKADTGSKIN